MKKDYYQKILIETDKKLRDIGRILLDRKDTHIDYERNGNKITMTIRLELRHRHDNQDKVSGM